MTQHDPAGLNLRGAVDLAALTAPKADPVDAPGGLVIEVTAQSFADAVQQSMDVPVVLDLYSTRSPASIELSGVLVDLVKEFAGRFVLARVAVDANPEIAQALQVQSLPTTVAVLKGQPVPLFQGAHPIDQVRSILTELLRVAAENGVTGTVAAEEDDVPPAPPEPELPPHIQAAYDAIENDDLDAATAAFTQALAADPGDAEARAGLAQVTLLTRLAGVDPAAALNAARDASPGDAATQLLAADVELSTGRSAAAYDRVLAVIRATAGDDRELARLRLLDLFTLAPEGSPEVAAARRQLALALF
ncbi:tetratricopeptide repeat protein [Pseudactinotalea sp. HY160]|uniref:tetratricopeptide repeat protein n=1 Tax=Pseudactinotalea sp. HY160 TaxID=2654490 RepID=UPI00128B148D|nr:tetratricopeptide repeat protein [Pseudactinotalea sp. HY160]MPV50309.1 tetratricopeptide repeat protein [Pseudactinotalea sp. HY160]